MHSFFYLADSLSPDLYNDLGKWLNIIVFLAGAVLLLLKISAHFKKADPLVPNPVVTKKAAEYTERREHTELKAEVHEVRQEQAKLSQRIHDVHLDLVQKGEQRARDLQDRISDILAAIKHLK